MDAVEANVRKVRDARGWSKAQLAQMVGYANATMIHQIEEGLKRPSSQQLQALAKVLEVTVSDLVGSQGTCAASRIPPTVIASGLSTQRGVGMMLEEVQESVRAVCGRSRSESGLLVAGDADGLAGSGPRGRPDGEGEA